MVCVCVSNSKLATRCTMNGVTSAALLHSLHCPHAHTMGYDKVCLILQLNLQYCCFCPWESADRLCILIFGVLFS